MAVGGNRIYVRTATVGIGTLTLGAAVTAAFMTFAEAGVTDGAVVRSFTIEEGSDFEISYGTYTAAGTTLTRTVIISKIGGVVGTTKMTLAGNATVRQCGVFEDVALVSKANTFTAIQTITGGNSGGIVNPAATLNFGSYYNSSTGSPISHIDLYGGIIGLGVSGGSFNFSCTGVFAFYGSGQTLANTPMFLVNSAGDIAIRPPAVGPGNTVGNTIDLASTLTTDSAAEYAGITVRQVRTQVGAGASKSSTRFYRTANGTLAGYLSFQASSIVVSGSGVSDDLIVSVGRVDAGGCTFTGGALTGGSGSVTGTFDVGKLTYGGAAGGSVATIGIMSVTITGASFASAVDQLVTIPLPTGYSGYRVQLLVATNPSTNASITGTAGLFTAVSGGGTAIMASGTSFAGLTTNAANTSGNYLAPTAITNIRFTTTSLYFRPQTTQAATIDYTIFYMPLP